MLNASETISSVLAKLVTNPSCLELNINNIDMLIASFDLSNEDEKLLREFFLEYGQKFFATTRLLKKRRWDNIKQSLQVVCKLFDPSELDNYWNYYLGKIEVTDIVPKNPLVESLLFCEGMLKSGGLSPLQSAIVEYEYTRNCVIVNYSTDFNDYTLAEKFKFIHPCYVIKAFQCNISMLVKALNAEKSIEELALIYQEQTEKLLFYKNWRKGGVASIKINSQVEQFINSFEPLTKKLIEVGVIQARGAV